MIEHNPETFPAPPEQIGSPAGNERWLHSALKAYRAKRKRRNGRAKASRRRNRRR